MGFLLTECENITLNSVLMTAARLSASQSGLCLLQDGRTVLQYANRGQVPCATDEQQTSPPQMDKHQFTGGLKLHPYDINSTYTLH